jgi:DNA-binding beta-propeller fold protein YncE
MAKVIDTLAQRATGGRRDRRHLTAALAVTGALLLTACGGTRATPVASPTPSPRATATAAASATVTPTATPASAAPTPTPPASDLIAYVAVSDGELVPIDVTTGVAEAPLTVDPAPTSVAISPDGRYAYVADGDVATVTPVNLVTGTVGTPNQVATNAGITALAITPSGATLLAVANPTGYDAGSVVPITLASGTAGAPIPVGADPLAIAVTPDGSTAYVVNAGDGTITPISLASDTAAAPISVGVDPMAITITPSGGTAYVLGGNGVGLLTPVTLAANPAQDVVGNPIAVQTGAPTAIAIAPSGTTAYVTGASGADQIVLPGNAGLGSTSAGDYSTVAISPDGSTALLGYGNSSGTAWGVVPVRLATAGPGATIPLHAKPVSIAFRP